jgi:DNA polymerase
MGTATALREILPTNGVGGVIAEIRAEIGNCRLCRGLRPHRKQPPGALGTTRTGYMLVGDAPDFSPRPFDDAAGQVLRQALQAVGDEEYRDLEDLFFLAHAARCVPRHPKNDRKIRRTRPPTRSECRTCRPFLQFEIRAMHPRLIIAVGAKAAEAVLGKSIRIGEAHGQRHRTRDAEVLTLLTPSPNNRAPLKKLDMTIENYSRWLTGLFGALVDDLRR